MSNRKNNLPRLLSPQALRSPLQEPGASNPLLKAQNAGLRPEKSLSTSKVNTGLSFGHMRSTKVPTTSAGANWEKFLGEAVSGGIGSILGTSSGLPSLAGVKSIFAGLESLFHSKKTQPALTAFALPVAQNQTIQVGRDGSSGVLPQTVSLQDHSAEIAQAVKSALLHSSSLNDVIGEL